MFKNYFGYNFNCCALANAISDLRSVTEEEIVIVWYEESGDVKVITEQEELKKLIEIALLKGNYDELCIFRGKTAKLMTDALSSMSLANILVKQKEYMLEESYISAKMSESFKAGYLAALKGIQNNGRKIKVHNFLDDDKPETLSTAVMKAYYSYKQASGIVKTLQPEREQLVAKLYKVEPSA